MPVGRMMIIRNKITITNEASLGLPPILPDRLLWSGCNAMASIRLHIIILTKGDMINRHQATINIRMKSLMVVS
jgi:hypothetical protein